MTQGMVPCEAGSVFLPVDFRHGTPPALQEPKREQHWMRTKMVWDFGMGLEIELEIFRAEAGPTTQRNEIHTRLSNGVVNGIVGQHSDGNPFVGVHYDNRLPPRENSP